MKDEEDKEFLKNLWRNQSLVKLRNNRTTAETDILTGTLTTRFFAVLLERKQAWFFDQVFFLSGEAGKPGKNKPSPGPPGPKGDQGPAGKTGAQGPRGAKGEKGQDGTGTSGVNYVRWGRTSCPSGAQIVYQGEKNRWPTH